MKNLLLERLIEIIEEDLEYIEHWDGKNLNKEQLEELIGGIEWDLKFIRDLIKDSQR